MKIDAYIIESAESIFLYHMHYIVEWKWSCYFETFIWWKKVL